MLIFFEGVDKVGKSTLINEVNKKTNYKHTLIDRGPISNLVYNKLLNRDCKEVIKTLDELSKIDYLVIYVEANNDIIKERMNKHNEKLIHEKLYDIDNVKNTFINSLQNCYCNYIVVNTTDKTIQESIDEILNYINREEEKYANK